MMDTEANRTDAAIEQIRACCQALDDKKAENLQVLCVKGRSSITDYFVLATGSSVPQLRAMSDHVVAALDTFDVETLQTNPNDRSGWSVVDAYDIIVHMFTKETRAFYNLEGLWKDADFLEVERFIEPVASNY